MLTPTPQIVTLHQDDHLSYFFDLDGVLLDSNDQKAENMLYAVSRHAPKDAEAFVAYFTDNNGIPRKQKLETHFSPELVTAILSDYNAANQTTLSSCQLTPGVLPLLRTLLDRKRNLYVFTGAEKCEATRLLEDKGILSYFNRVFGGPKTKLENYRSQTFAGPTLMIGDARSDHDFAQKISADFVFMAGFTNFKNWSTYFKSRPIAGIIRNLTDLHFSPSEHAS